MRKGKNVNIIFYYSIVFKIESAPEFLPPQLRLNLLDFLMIKNYRNKNRSLINIDSFVTRLNQHV